MKTIEEKAIEYANENTGFGLSKEMAIRAYIAGAMEALAGQWRSVDDELPKAEQDVLVSMGWGEFGVAWLSALSNGTCKWYSNDDTLSLNCIKYWMPIPEPPKDESR